MNPQQFVTQEAQYASQAHTMSGGARGGAGMAPYPLYGFGQADAEVPFYRRPLVCAGAGAAVVGALWIYFGWWRPRSAKKQKKNGKARAAKLRKELDELEQADEA